jgi:hypothetical protein
MERNALARWVERFPGTAKKGKESKKRIDGPSQI